MDMKASLATVIVSGLMLSNSAFASNTGVISFIGSITNTTCDFVGLQDGTQTNTIDLGTYTVDAVNKGTTPIINFSLIGKQTNNTPCEVGTNGVTVFWLPASGTWEAAGLKNTGTAKGTAVKLMNKNNSAFSSQNYSVNYTEAEAPNGALPFEAQLVKSGIATAGTVVSSAKFAVAYK